MYNEHYYNEYARTFQRERQEAGRKARLLKAGRPKTSIWRLALSWPKFGDRISRRHNKPAHYLVTPPRARLPQS